MRIIAGEFKGRRLLAPESDTTRPITDRVKQSLFDILAPSIPGSRVYDCFAGTGSMGLECLSRGAESVTFFEADRSALKRLRQNIDSLGLIERYRVEPGDLFAWFRSTAETRAPIDLLFLDPPYRFLRDRQDDLRALAESIASRHLAPGGIVVFRHDSRDRLELPALTSYDERDYGGMTIEFLRLRDHGQR